MRSAGRVQATAPPLPTPPPPFENSEEELEEDESTDNVFNAARHERFMADAEREAKEERVAHAAFDAEMGRRG
jgi:hypothetical protein